MAMLELRRYISYGQLIIWPRIIINLRNRVGIVITANASGRDEVRNDRCSIIDLIKRGSLPSGFK